MMYGTANAKTATLSFWVRSSLTGTFGGSITNSAQNYSYPFTYTILASNTWEYKTVTFTGPTDGTWLATTNRGVGVFFSLGMGSTYSGTAGSWSGNQGRAFKEHQLLDILMLVVIGLHQILWQLILFLFLRSYKCIN
jgi:hypothetical protein